MAEPEKRRCFVIRRIVASFDGYAPPQEKVVAILSDDASARAVYALIGDGSIREEDLPSSPTLAAQIAFGNVLARTIKELAATHQNLLESLSALVPPDMR